MNKIQFAVVGHPNKGKSSIVSTLARNDSILVSRRSGTTKKASGYQVSTPHADFELIDTPGFQRPTQALKWLQAHAESADQRSRAVRLFVSSEECQNRFPDEVEILNPLMRGAAILYVVDGSRPYGQEYEAEMEILRWTGRASMALINPIENESHVTAWEKALAQYFKIVRVFDPMLADFDRQISLLEAFAHLQAEWQQDLSRLVTDLRQQQAGLVKQSATILADLLEDLCCYQYRQKALSKSQARSLESIVGMAYQRWMRQREEKAFEEMKAVYAFQYSELKIESMDYPPQLFDLEQWYVWGLNRKQLLTFSAASGATAGAAIDVAVAGHSFMLGALGGGLLGLGGALFGGEKLTKLQIKGLPLGGFEACQGPIRDKNFPFVVLGRFVYLFSQLKNRNHARRDDVKVENLDLFSQIKNLSGSDKKALTSAMERLSKQKAVDSMADILLPLLQSID
jgi:GTPase Era involved in 16S rRNA processing